MPSVITDPSLINQSGIINNGSSPSSDVWQFPDTPAQSIVNFQAVPAQPLPAGTDTATGLISPDLTLAGRLTNFSPDVYDLAPGSSLTHLMQALLGDSGVGQLRKRQLMARLQEGITGAQFYDLDSFYGALFGDVRGPSGSLPVNPSTGVTVNPYTDLASRDGWDDIQAADADFRERIIQLARAITLGGTVPGLQALGEAISGVECHVYEVWRLIDTEGPQGGVISADTWAQVEASYATWSAFPAGITWAEVQGLSTGGSPSLGGLGINCRNEVIIIPRRNYDSSAAGQQEQASDLYGITAVTEVLKPASVLLSVSTEAQEISVPVTPAAIWADSENWDIAFTVIPENTLDPAYAQALASYQRGGQVPSPPYSVPFPPNCRSQGTQISYAPAVTVAWAQASPIGQPGSPVDVQDYEVETILGQQVTYTARLGLIDQIRAASARASSAAGLQAAPYAGPRVPAVTAG